MEIKPPTDEQIMSAVGNSNFGNADPVLLIKSGLLKFACGYWTGHTVMCILHELKLITTWHNGKIPRPTKYGGRVLYLWVSPLLRTTREAQH